MGKAIKKAMKEVNWYVMRNYVLWCVIDYDDVHWMKGYEFTMKREVKDSPLNVGWLTGLIIPPTVYQVIGQV